MKVRAELNLFLHRSVRAWMCITVLTMSVAIGVSPWPTGARSQRLSSLYLGAVYSGPRYVE
jgi:hypothetical protein